MQDILAGPEAVSSQASTQTIPGGPGRWDPWDPWTTHGAVMPCRPRPSGVQGGPSHYESGADGPIWMGSFDFFFPQKMAAKIEGRNFGHFEAWTIDDHRGMPRPTPILTRSVSVLRSVNSVFMALSAVLIALGLGYESTPWLSMAPNTQAHGSPRSEQG